MSALRDQINEELKTAMRAGDTAKKEVLRYLNAAIKQVEIDTREPLTDEKIFSVLQKELKSRRESLQEAQNAGRDDLAGPLNYEISLIEGYLPRQLTPDELRAEVAKAVAEVGATTPKEMGAVMKVLMPRVKDRANGKAIQDAVQAALKP